METRNVEFILGACSGKLVAGLPGTLVKRVNTDSRAAQPGDLFIALAGERHDGHDFLRDVVQKGVAAVMVERNKVPTDLPKCAVIVVENTRKALGQVAARYRSDFSLPMVAVGGSNGKTTTKELLASILRQKLDTVWSEASFNNDIGVPLTLLRLEKKHEAGVMEVGTNHPGELEPLLGMVQPRMGVITSIGREHLEFFNDLAGVAREEGTIAEKLPAGGVLFMNGDSEWTPEIVHRTRARAVRVGMGARNDWRARNIRLASQGVTFRVETARTDFSGDYKINLLGRHQVMNALLAMAVGAEMGLSRAEIERGLAECQPPKMRMQLWESNSVRVLDDAYNANADSMLAALQTLHDMPCKGRRIAVLGDMAELGSHSEEAHLEVGRRVAESGVGQLFTVGKMAALIAKAAREKGLNRVFEFADVEAAAPAVKSFVKAGDVILIKASRAARLERIAEVLRTDGRKN
ncbi:MAG TPA: UDP-N-acetylmuramoyl-tripeptide--D-alanyl-D-alanine ligase [Candidatus Polarisedimenticolia bacterium]|nr:UDP-N-acetylmuramoyl-tripeptide--D-alanyl-D-alanine ligase [Candidatus Polarisedimenticolia bacterium]